MRDTLTPRQQRFIEEYLVDTNATQAAMRAGYSARTANEQGSRLLANVSVAAVLQQRQKALSERVEVTQADVVRGLMAIATDPDAVGVARVRAYELVGKHLGMFTERTESKNVNVNVDGGPVVYRLVLGEERGDDEGKYGKP